MYGGRNGRVRVGPHTCCRSGKSAPGRSGNPVPGQLGALATRRPGDPATRPHGGDLHFRASRATPRSRNTLFFGHDYSFWSGLAGFLAAPAPPPPRPAPAVTSAAGDRAPSQPSGYGCRALGGAGATGAPAWTSREAGPPPLPPLAQARARHGRAPGREVGPGGWSDDTGERPRHAAAACGSAVGAGSWSRRSGRTPARRPGRRAARQSPAPHFLGTLVRRTMVRNPRYQVLGTSRWRYQ